jgi:hypothetical protein
MVISRSDIDEPNLRMVRLESSTYGLTHNSRPDIIYIDKPLTS